VGKQLRVDTSLARRKILRRPSDEHQGHVGKELGCKIGDVVSQVDLEHLHEIKLDDYIDSQHFTEASLKTKNVLFG
jgi:hypothetical protein